MWTTDTAIEFVNRFADAFSLAGFSPRLIGSVATRGHSSKDLDILLEPLEPSTTLECAIAAFEREMLPLISDDNEVNPVESPTGEWFVNVGLQDGRVLECYFPQPVGL